MSFSTDSSRSSHVQKYRYITKNLKTISSRFLTVHDQYLPWNNHQHFHVINKIFSNFTLYYLLYVQLLTVPIPLFRISIFLLAFIIVGTSICWRRGRDVRKKKQLRQHCYSVHCESIFNETRKYMYVYYCNAHMCNVSMYVLCTGRITEGCYSTRSSLALVSLWSADCIRPCENSWSCVWPYLSWVQLYMRRFFRQNK